MNRKSGNFFLFFCSFLMVAFAADSHAAVKLITPSGYVPGMPFLARVELLTGTGARDLDQWNATATLSTDRPDVTLSSTNVTLRNGLGTALITINGTTDFNLKAEVAGQQTTRAIVNRSALPVTTVSGTLAGTSSTWSGVVRINGTVTIPATHTLTIDPGTLVLIDGVASGTTGFNIVVNGAIRSLGTEVAPVVITCNSATLNWGQIRHETSQPSLYQYTLISRAGRTVGEGHTGTGPALSVSNSTIDFEGSVISDLHAGGVNIGKIMMSSGSSLTFNNCVLTRARMGPEIASTGLMLTNSYIMEMHGPDDSDGFYLHDSSGRSLLVTGCVIADGDDDALDTLDANVTVENCILRDWPNPNEDAKGLSAFHGEVIMRHCLIVDTYAGVSAKSSGALAVVRLDHCTIDALTRGVAAATKSTANAGNINIYMTNCVVNAADSIVSDFTPDKFVSVNYCLFRETWPGVGNLNADPLFVAPQSGNYRLQANSPAVNAGDPASPPDLDGTRSDMGFYPRLSAPLTEPAVVINEIMYHPQSENPLEEYIELFNQGATAITLGGWRFSKGVDFTFPNISLQPGAYLVVAANTNAFKAKYPGIANVIGNWAGTLSNSREDIVLDDATGNTVDQVHYADEGDWAVRQRGALDRGHRGWTWFAEHDGLGKSVELINPRMSNSNGQNWAASVTAEGTPGRANSAAAQSIPPIIENVAHFPLVPKSTDDVLITAKILADQGLAASGTLFYRVDAATPPAFSSIPMHDDGLNGDALANDKIFSALIPHQNNNSVVEFYVSASDTLSRARTWPAPAIASLDGVGPTGQVVNALYQVDDSEYTGAQPLYKIVMTEAERAELQQIDDNINNAANSDAAMNATFLSFDGTGAEVRYLTSARNRGHGSRTRKPNNFRVGFRSDDEWKKMTALNLNGQFSWLQILGAALNLRSEIPGAYSRAVQLRVNNVNLAFTGLTEITYGSYAANEPIDSDWADRHFPNDSQGNIYRALRDIVPPDFDYRVISSYPTLFGPEDSRSYTNTWYKENNASENNWTDLIGMLRVIGPHGSEPFTPANAQRVADVSEWMRHLAVMNLLGNNETGLNTGYNDDYFMYAGVNDPRFRLVYYDLDTILGFNNSLPDNAQLFSAANNNGSGIAFGRLMHDPAFEPLYYAHLRNLLETSFSAEQFDLIVDQTLGGWVPDSVRTQIKAWMDRRRTFVLGQLPATIPLHAPRAILSDAPRSPTPIAGAVFSVSGENITHYKYSLNGAPFSAEIPVATAITLNNLANGAQTLAVIGKRSDGVWQLESDATTATWTVNGTWPGVRLNEILADSATGAKDAIELYNEGPSTVVLTGMGLTDNSGNPHKFTFDAASLASGAYLVVDSSQLGFGLDAQGETVSLYASAANGGALLDSVTFGLQLPDLSIGRTGPNGIWTLTSPTLSGLNIGQLTADVKQIKINEWLASGISPFPDDFVELFNPEILPAAIGGVYLSDEPIGDPARSRIAPLSFIAPRGYAVFTAGNGNQANEINFKIGADQGQIALLTPELTIVDQVVYGPQSVGVSSGRCGDGEATIKILNSPTPGGPNECPVVPPPPQSITLLAFTNTWKYDANGTDLLTQWKDLGYADGSWNSGPGPLGVEDPNVLPEPIRTTIPLGPRTTYFRTHFNVDPTLAVSSLEFTVEIDDGAAFYLNGQEIPGTRYNLSSTATFGTAAINAVNNATLRTFTAAPDLLRAGDNLLAVEVHQNGSNSGDIVMGLKLDALVVTNSPAQAGVMINEVFADNATLNEADGTHPDWVELYNPSDDSVDLAGMSLTDQLGLPTRWVFPAGSILAAKGFFKVRFDADLPASNTNTGFGLKANGGAVFLFNRPADNSSLLSSIRYGLQATDWSIGRVPDGSTNWVLTIPSIGGANSAATLGNAQNLKINEWMAEPASGSDWFEIYNPNAEPTDLSHLWLADSVTTRQKTQLPALSFIGVGARGFQKFDADDAVSKGPDHVAFKLDGTGEALAISNPAGALINAVQFSSQLLGISQGHLPDGSGAITSFRGSPSPGAANFLLLDNVVVNELLSHTDAPLMDAVEFYNPTATAVDISGWYLSDSGINLKKFQIPANTSIPGNGYIVFYEDQFNSDLASERFSFSSAKGDEVYLSQANGGVLTGYRASASFGPAENGVSFGRFQTSQGYDFVPMAQRTFGRDNPATTNEFRLGTGAANSYAKVGPVVISEIMYHPATNEALEFIELHNIAATNVPLYDLAKPANTWRIRKGADFEFATGTTIPAGGYIVIANFDPQSDPLALASFEDAYPTLTGPLVGPFRGQLDNGGDSIELQKPDAPQIGGPDDGLVPYVMVDHIEYKDASPWPIAADGAGNSLNRINDTLYGNDPVNWFAAAPSPGSSPIPDRDHDGIPDQWEIDHGFNPDLASDAQLDKDGDGLTNLAEYQRGTDPSDPSDPLVFKNTTVAATGVALHFGAAAGKTYSIIYSDGSPTGPWTKLRDIAPTSNGIIEITDAPGVTARFYRLVTPALP